MSGARPAAGPYAVMAVLVTLAAGAVGGVFGGLGTWLYYEPPGGVTDEGLRIRQRIQAAGPILGCGSGILTGIAWCRILVRRARRSSGPLVGRGALLGAAAGFLSTVVLHVGLVVIKGGPAGLDVFLFSVGLNCLTFGIPAGAIVGSLGGCALEIARRRAGAGGAGKYPEAASTLP